MLDMQDGYVEIGACVNGVEDSVIELKPGCIVFDRSCVDGDDCIEVLPTFVALTALKQAARVRLSRELGDK